MERVIRWIDVDGSSSRAAGTARHEWHGASLRPTGVVVFATLDTRRRGPVRRSPGDGFVTTAPTQPHGANDRVTRRRWHEAAWRALAWLLGR
ncbi:MAG TPA: hypothetical protein VK283_00600 [Acidimicrobiales bacterium]|nr:hypothetical protein [Acidimicrobiales bacterium]